MTRRSAATGNDTPLKMSNILDTTNQEKNITRAEYDELMQKLKAVEIEKNKLARELRLQIKRNDFYQFSVEAQSGLSNILSAEKQRQEMYVNLLLESCPDIMFIIDENMKFLLGTNAVTNIIDIDDVSLLQGRKLDGIIERYHPPALTEEVVALIKKTIVNRGGNKVEKLHEVSAEDKKYEVAVVPFHNKANEFVGVLVVMIDITSILTARDLAEAGTRAKSEFLARMSHEIRTPMNAILGIAYLCLQTELLPKQHDYLVKIQTAATNLLGIIDDLLDFSKIEAGKMELEQIPLCVAEVVHEATVLIEQKAKEKGLELIVQLQDIGNELLLGDPLRLRQVLTNLLNNAVKFTEKGSVTVTVCPVMVGSSFVTLSFSVKDTGIGITPEQLQRLFQSFSQADDSTTRRYGGTGLGLAISKNLIELMGGTITVDSVPQQGTTFNFQLQFSRLNRTVPGGPYTQLSAKRVLVVDDNREALEIIGGIVQSFDMRVDMVDSGHAAIAALAQASDQGDPYQILLLDWKMPRMDGIETVRRIRHSEKITDLPQVLMVSAYDRSECLRQANGLGIVGFVVKPVTYSTIRDAIFDALMAQHFIEPENAANSARQQDSIKGAQVLLVEDNKINQIVASEMLQMLGVELTIVDNGQKAVDAVSLQDFDLVLMDVQMPVMDGLTAARAIRLLDKPGIDKLPIIAMTANAMDIDYKRSFEAGMNGHLTKPIDPVKLRHALETWIAPRQPGGRDPIY